MLKRVMLGVAALGLMSGVSSAQDKTNPLDEALPNYEATQGVTGSIKSMGSDTMNNIMTLWGELFMKAYPGVSVEVIGKGSSTAPPALTEGQAQFGPMSREMKAAEVDRFGVTGVGAPAGPVRLSGGAGPVRRDSLARKSRGPRPPPSRSMQGWQQIRRVRAPRWPWPRWSPCRWAWRSRSP